MKHSFVVILFVLLGLLIPSSVLAQSNFRSGDIVVLQKNEIIENDYFATGERITIEGTVNGDAYLAGGDVTILGTVTGDVLVVAGNVTINGTINGNIRAGAGNFTINGTIAKNITSGAGNIAITPSAKVGGSVTLGAGNITIQSPIGKSITAGAGKLTIGNKVGGDVNVAAEDVYLSEQASIAGNMLYWSESQAELEAGASISGQITHRIPQTKTKDASSNQKGMINFWFGWQFMSFLTTLFLGSLLLKLVPEYITRSMAIFTSKPLTNLGVGFLMIAATPVMIILLLVTMIGIPLIGIWLFALGIGMWLAKLYASLILGNWLTRQFKLTWNRYLVFGVGLFLFIVITSIPVIGWLVGFIISLIGLGAFILTKRDYYVELRQQKLV